MERPLPQGQKLECKIVRRKEGMEKLYPQYELYIEEEDETKVFILAARKRKKSHPSNYIITTTRSKTAKSKDEIVGNVRSNFLGTAFTIYDSGRNPFKSKEDQSMPIREELGGVLYEPNILGFKGPRKMTVLLPAMTKDGMRIPFRPLEEKDTILERHKVPFEKEVLVLHNKTPQWNDDTQSFVLNFNSRVTQASVKNFQIVHDNDLDYIIMQFGRVSDDTFTLDFQYPLSPVQAFGIALTSFDAKLACE
ncbi:hypothetical protein HDU97_002584 [Phlyctochytrium planicorne]|nr:hypothetical protein HDU97_002584 [Phlyctochytrium planicorne]